MLKFSPQNFILFYFIYLFYFQRKINQTGKINNFLKSFWNIPLGDMENLYNKKIKLFNAEMLNLSWYYGSCQG
jgi:hypothetical protein